MFLANGFDGSLSKIIFGLIGIALIASSSAVINQILDVEIDSKMTRTKNRPLVIGEISQKSAKTFAAALLVSGIIILFAFNNVLTIFLTLLTWAFYSFFYTKILKFAGTQNIVIGGIAGAMPPLLGWTAITNSIDALPLLMVLIIFIWTPPHFWALAINRKEDYVAAKVPMMPVVKGTEYTKIQIFLYSILLTVTSLFPFATGYLGGFYFLSALVLNTIFIGFSLALMIDKANKLALPLFLYSIVYLTLLFIFMVLDKLIPVQI
jgi:protoheme IX farnesyltransferase